VLRTSAEVLIIGAGPAGSATALWLARQGRDVLILERARFPRDKPCGDCVNPGAVAELVRLGVAQRLEEKLTPNPLYGWHVEAPDGQAFRAEFGLGPEGEPLRGWAVRRREFDTALLEEALCAGARVEFGLGVLDVLLAQGRVVGVLAREGTVEREYRATFLVAADGLRSIVRRRLDLTRRPPRLRKIAVVGHLARANSSGSFGELRVRDGRSCGYAPLGLGANVTLVVPQHEAGQIAPDPAAFLTAAVLRFPEVFDRVRRCGLERRVMVTGPFDWPVRRPWAPGAILVGDAAGYYDPLTGQGIHQALGSARLASQAVERALRDPSTMEAVFSKYGRVLEWDYRPKRALQRLIEATVSRPAVMSRFVRGLSGDMAVASRLLRATGDVLHPVTLLDPLLWPRLAIRMVKGTNAHA
jgi:flavin-dependent dehydrogenase